jgi:hypothetical protein
MINECRNEKKNTAPPRMVGGRRILPRTKKVEKEAGGYPIFSHFAQPKNSAETLNLHTPAAIKAPESLAEGVHVITVMFL